MPFRLRLVLASLLLALPFVVPAPDAAQRLELTRLLVREWLFDPASPLLTEPPTRPLLQVDLRASPPLTERTELAAELAAYTRLAEEWWRGRGGDPTAPVQVVPLLLRVGEHGVHATLTAATDQPRLLERRFPTGLSLLPPLAAIAVAVAFRRVLLALVIACLVGAVTHTLLTAAPGTGAVATAFAAVEHLTLDVLLRRVLGEDFHLRVTLFVLLLFVTIGIVNRNGGVLGLVARLNRFVRGPRSAQLATVATGSMLFVDDYTSCLVTPTAMRPLCDAHGVSRAKLAYLVDSTAAPIAGLSLFSTWVVYEMSLYAAPLSLVTRPDGTPYRSEDTLEVFVASLPYRFYSWFALALVVLVVVLRRDVGPMLQAERRARTGDLAAGDVPADAGLLAPFPGAPRRARNAAGPLVTLVVGTLATMAAQGFAAAAALPDGAGAGEWLRTLLGEARSDVALLVGTTLALAVALLQTLSQRLLPARELGRAAVRALRPLPIAFGVLLAAWCLGHVCKDLGTSFHLTAMVQGSGSAAWLPLSLFLVASGIAFATGTSFGTMAILLPNVVLLAHQLGTEAAFGGSAAIGGTALLLVAIGAVLEGSIFGDHCSPISDTTVLSALGSGCDHLEHVATQLPYALAAMATAALFGYLPVALLGPDLWPLALPAGVLVQILWLRRFGRDPAG